MKMDSCDKEPPSLLVSTHLLEFQILFSSSLPISNIMSQVANEHKRSKKPEKHDRLVSFALPKSNVSHPSQSRSVFGKNPNKKKRFLFVKFDGMGCKGGSLPSSATEIIRSAADWEGKGSRNGRLQRRNKNSRNLANVAIDVPDACCTPPGIGIYSDFSVRNRNPAPRIDRRKHSRESRRNEDGSGSRFGVGSRNDHRSVDRIIEILMTQQSPLPGRIILGEDPYHDWRLDVDQMSYEELLDLSETIGYVGTGLPEEEISSYLRICKHFSHDSTSLLGSRQSDWKCSICQEKCRRDDEIAMLECGHYHHVNCIKQWLLKKNACPICKCPAKHH